MTQEKYHLPSMAIVIVILLVISLIPFFLRKENTVQSQLPLHLEWSEKNENGSIEIAGFTEGENWEGNYTLDSERSIDGNSGLNLFSQNGQVQEIKLNKEVDLSSFDSLLLTVYIENENVIQQPNNLILYLITNDKKQFSIPISPLKRGWNLLSLPLSSLTDEKQNETLKNKNILTFGFKLNSQKKQISQITIDRLWAEKNRRPYLSQISSLNPISTSLKTIDKHTFLNLFSSGINRLSFTQTEQLDNFTAIFKIIPESKGLFGFYMTSKNIPKSEISFIITNENKWKLENTQNENVTNNLVSGKLQEFYNISTPFWLRVIKKNDSLSIDYSTNGSLFLTITESNKVNIGTGTFGLLSNGAFLLDYIDIKP